jgi:hypothetical protein
MGQVTVPADEVGGAMTSKEFDGKLSSLGRSKTTNGEQAELPACPLCGSHGQLIDLHEKSKRLGIEFSKCEPMYSVICCGYYLPISDEKQLAALVQFLMRKNDSAGTQATTEQCASLLADWPLLRGNLPGETLPES